jgi:predicted amidophosphoribosyltransferase
MQTDPPEHQPLGTCIACGASLSGVSYRDNCPSCGTPAAMSLSPPPVLEQVVEIDHDCIGCGASLHNLPVNGFCPRCATPIAESLAHGPAKTVPDDRPCLMCGYNIRDLPLTGVCPECGTPVERSIRGALLKYSAPEYLARLHKGIVYAELATAAKLFTWLPPILVRSRNAATQTLEDVLDVLFTGIMLFGWWMFTTPDPAFATLDPAIDHARRSRRAVRLIIVLWATFVVLSGVFFHLPKFAGSILWFPTLTQWMMALLGVIFLAGYLRSMAPRVPNRTLHERASLFQWLIPLLFGAAAFGVVCCPIGLAGLAGLILFFVMIEPWRSALKAIRQTQVREAAQAVLP